MYSIKPIYKMATTAPRAASAAPAPAIDNPVAAAESELALPLAPPLLAAPELAALAPPVVTAPVVAPPILRVPVIPWSCADALCCASLSRDAKLVCSALKLLPYAPVAVAARSLRLWSAWLAMLFADCRTEVGLAFWSCEAMAAADAVRAASSEEPMPWIAVAEVVKATRAVRRVEGRILD